MAAKIDKGLGGMLEILCILVMVLFTWIQNVWKGMPARTDCTACGFQLWFKNEVDLSVSRVVFEKLCWKNRCKADRSVRPGETLRKALAQSSAPQMEKPFGGGTAAKQLSHG